MDTPDLTRPWAPALHTSHPSFSPGLALADLLQDLRHNQGFAILPPEMLRYLGQHSTRSLLKRHGYDLGLQDAAHALAQAGNEHPAPSVTFLVQALRRCLAISQVTTNYTPAATAPDMALEWTCTLDFPAQLNLEQRVNHENTTVWLLTGYACGYLQQCFDKHYSISYAKSFLGPSILYHFSAHAPQSVHDLDMDLFPAGSQLQPGAMPHSAATARPTSTAAPAAIRVLQEKSELFQTLRLVAPTDASVLLLGESGVGKSLVAREIHALSQRAHQPWVEINCAALPEQLMESELFGVERGAFSGALQARKGKFEQAHGGTLFLDEVGLLSLSAQSKLLRVLQSGEFERLGSNTTIGVDVRLITATNEPLRALVKAGKFREDLYYRLNVFPLTLAPLRERRNEIPQLVAHIIKHYAAKYKKTIYRCTPQAREAILAHAWPGNIRELHNVLERAVILCPDAAEIHTTHLGPLDDGGPWEHQPPPSNPPPLPVAPKPHSAMPARALPASPAEGPASLDDLADQLLDSGSGRMAAIKDALARAAVRHSHGNISHAAAMLGLTRGQLSYQLKKMQPSDGDLAV